MRLGPASSLKCWCTGMLQQSSLQALTWTLTVQQSWLTGRLCIWTPGCTDGSTRGPCLQASVHESASAQGSHSPAAPADRERHTRCSFDSCCRHRRDHSVCACRRSLPRLLAETAGTHVQVLSPVQEQVQPTLSEDGDGEGLQQMCSLRPAAAVGWPCADLHTVACWQVGPART